MLKVNSPEDLRSLIVELELRQEIEWKQLKWEAHEFYLKIQPATVLKTTMNELLSSTEVKNGMYVPAIVGIVVFLVKRYVAAKSVGIVPSLLGVFAEAFVIKK